SASRSERPSGLAVVLVALQYVRDEGRQLVERAEATSPAGVDVLDASDEDPRRRRRRVAELDDERSRRREAAAVPEPWRVASHASPVSSGSIGVPTKDGKSSEIGGC